MNGMTTTVDLPMDDAEATVRAALAEHGFGILTEIDIAATLKTRIGVDRAPLKILGACNPTFAHQALQLDPSAALLLPCNVTLEPSSDGGTRVSIADPLEMMPGADFAELAGAASAQLRAALDALSG